MSKNLTTRSEDYSKWYNELVVKADLAENSGVRGCMVIKPYGYAIWEKCKQSSIECLRNWASKCLFPIICSKEHV
jgi:prolyl-tRNA synthetase